jgi:hypothetical protein
MSFFQLSTNILLLKHICKSKNLFESKKKKVVTEKNVIDF